MDYYLNLITLWAIFAVAATVVATLVEDAGFIHVGAAAFMGIGAYTVALLTSRAGVGPQIALISTVPSGIIAGCLLSFAVRKLRGDGLALATLAVGIIVHGVMLNAVSFTGGSNGIAGIPRRPPLTTHDAFDALLLLVVAQIICAIMRHTDFGKRVHALREDEELAGDLELRPQWVRTVLWAASSAILSVSGGLFAFHLRSIDPSSFSVRESIAILTMSLIIPRPKGLNACIGSLIFIALPEIFRYLGLPETKGAEIRQLLFSFVLLLVITRVKGLIGRAITKGVVCA